MPCANIRFIDDVVCSTGMSAVQRARQSYLEGADRASRDFTRVDRPVPTLPFLLKC